MPSNRNDPDPLEARRRHLAERERLLSEERRRLTEQLQPGAGSAGHAKPAEPPVWRMEEDGRQHRVTESPRARKRNLARQTRRDMIVVFGLIILFLIVLFIVLWVAYVHNTAPNNGA